jgi:hypothetical protein
MWNPEAKEIPVETLPTLLPGEVLFEFEEPLTFVCPDRDGQLLLAHSLNAGVGSRAISSSPPMSDFSGN